ncbi:MAG: phospholipase [Planctomycetia bacterium]|nr:phospholipase [Planctomycetia bacterium]
MRSLLTILAAVGLISSSRAADLEKLLEKRTFTKDKAMLPYRLMKPDGYDGTKQYPIVIFLHGAGERGNDNKAQLKHGIKDFASDENRKKYPCFLLVPQCPSHPKRWADWSAKAPISEKPTEPLALVLGILTELKAEFKIDPKRVYVTGLSMGGFGTWDLIARHPELFAAGVPICGGGDPSQAAKIAPVPVWVFHGAKDKVVVVQRSREMVEALKKAGAMPKYTEYPQAEHDSWTASYSDPKLMDWLFAQKK